MTVEQNTQLSRTDPFGLPPALRKPRLRREETSKYLELAHGIIMAPSTLATLASRGGGPPFQKINRTPLYPRTAIDEWAFEKLGPLRNSTSDE